MGEMFTYDVQRTRHYLRRAERVSICAHNSTMSAKRCKLHGSVEWGPVGLGQGWWARGLLIVRDKT
jgi:hypothetical protein